MPVSLLVDDSIPNNGKGLPGVCRGRVFVVECGPHDFLFVLCAKDQIWDKLTAYNKRGQFLKGGDFFFQGNNLTISFVEEWIGDWPSISQQAYASADLNEDFEDSPACIFIVTKRKPRQYFHG